MPPFGLTNDSGPGLILVKTALDKLIDDMQQQAASVGKALPTDPIIFTQDTATNAAVVASVEGGGGYFEQTTQDVSSTEDANISAAAPKTTLVIQFKQNLPISRTFMEDQQLSAVSKAVRQRYQAWQASQQRNAFYVYANGFSGSTTGVMSDANLNVLVVSLRGQVSQGGVKVGYEPDFLLASSLGDHDARIVAKSVLRSGTGNNDLNYYSEMYPGMQVKFNQFLDDVSTTAYFIGTRGHDVMRYEREAFFTDLVNWTTDENDLYKYKMRAREVVDALSYVGVAGSDGTVS